jgi:hypothetical protein
MFALLSVGVSVAGILGSQTVRAQSCGMDCRVEYDCYDVVYACGSNPDGTVMMCVREVCEPVDVCVPKPCGAQPDPDSPFVPIFPDGPVLPIFPIFPGAPGGF